MARAHVGPGAQLYHSLQETLAVYMEKELMAAVGQLELVLEDFAAALGMNGSRRHRYDDEQLPCEVMILL